MVNDSTTTPPSGGAPPSDAPYGGPRSGLSGRGTRFFDWMRSTGIVRTDGWVGGVCAGIAYRIGIDPLIVRGMVVVAALLGAPVLLLYALAWALFPDRDGRIHLQRLFEGEFEPPLVAVGVLVLLSLLPWSNGIWWFSGPLGPGSGWWDVVGRVFATLVVLAAASALVVVGVRAADSRRRSTPRTDASAAPSSAPPVPDHPASAAATTAPFVATGAEPAAPPAPGAGATEQQVEDWHAREAQWRAEHELWKQRLAADMRVVKAQRSAELQAQASAASAAAKARRVAYRAANPRVGAAIGWLAVGLALVAAAVTGAIWGALTGLPGYALAASLAAAALVLGVTVLIAGVARRRSGFLIFLGILLAALTALAALLPTSPGLRLEVGAAGSPAVVHLAQVDDVRITRVEK